jgi:hypothetical protein
MLELAVTTANACLEPPVIFQHTDDVSDLHASIMPESSENASSKNLGFKPEMLETCI